MDLTATIACPKCKRRLAFKIKEMVPGRKKSCPSCGAEIVFSGDDGRKTQKALDDLAKTIRKIGK